MFDAASDDGRAAHRTPLSRPRWLSERVWPFETFALDVDETSIAVTDIGEGPILLFVHTGTWSFIWRDAMRRLQTDFRCVCLDLPGTGRSGLPPDGVTLEGAARAVAGVLDQLDLTDVTMVTHDLAAPVSVGAAARAPARIVALVTVNAFALRQGGAVFRGIRRAMGSPLIRMLDILTGVLPRITATTFGLTRHLDPASRRAFRAGIAGSHLRAFHRYMADTRPGDTLSHEAGAALTGSFAHLPLLVICGERDESFGFQTDWNTRFPDADQVVTRCGKHFPMWDDPECFAHTIRQWHADRVSKQDAANRPAVPNEV
jgi:haloalkane dehalogenase